MIHDNQIIFDKRIIIRDNLAMNLVSFYVEDPEDISEWCHWKGHPIMFCEKTYEELKGLPFKINQCTKGTVESIEIVLGEENK